MTNAVAAVVAVLLEAWIVPPSAPSGEPPPLAQPATAAPSVAPQVFSGRGVGYFEGRVRCPLAGVGQRAPFASNRLGLDDDYSRVTVDGAAKRIIVDNSHAYPHRQVIVDLMLLGTAAAADGRRVPLGVHVKLEKKKSRVDVDVHPHWTEQAALHDPEVEPFEVIVREGSGERVVVTRDALLRAAVQNKIAYRIEDSLIEVRDNLEGQPLPRSLGAGAALANLSLGFGTKHLNKMLLRAELLSLDDANRALAGKPVAEQLARGAWELRLTALSSLLSQETLRRDLFLLGLDGLPVIAVGMARGLGKGESLTFQFRAGKGHVAWGAANQDFDGALDVARAFLEFNFLGALLARQALAVVAAGPAAPPTPQTR